MLVLIDIPGHVHAELGNFECMVRCDNCSATGLVICFDCNGTTEIDCTECNGIGCDSCASGKVICNTCGGEGKVICNYCSGGCWVKLPNHKWIPATTTTLERCEYCNGTRGDIVISPDTKLTNTFALVEQDIFTNTVVSVGIPCYAHTFVVDELPTNPLPALMCGVFSTPAVEIAQEDISSVIFNAYYLTSDEKIYLFNETYFCWSDMPEEKLQDFFSYGGIVDSVDDIDNSTFDENIYVYFQKPQAKEQSYFLNFMYQVDDEDIVTDTWYYDSSFLSTSEMLVDYTSELFLQNLRDEYKEKYYISKIEFCPAGKSPAISLETISNGDKVNLVYTDEYEYNTFVITLSYKFQGIKYYFENNLIYTDTRTTWDNSLLWNASSIDKSSWCSFEKLVYQERSKQKVISSVDDLKQFAKEYTLNNGYIEVDLLKVHDNYYYGSSIIYKKNTAFLTADTINQILAENILTCEHTLTYVFQDVDYVGNGTKLGTYSYKIKFDDKEIIIKIIVTDKINSDYIYGNHLYYPINNKLSTGQIVDDMKKTGLIANTNLSTQFTGRNESSSNFLSGKNNQVGTYSYVVDYESATGESGSTQVFLDILEAKVFTTDDPVPEEKDYKEIVENVIAIAIMVLIVFIICWLLFGKRKRR